MAEIKTADLIAKFKYAVDNHWGYIMNTAGILWTEEKQKNTKIEMAQKFGAQWIGHMVSDCSGLFYWAFKQLGGYMYHGSNTMWKSYCTSKGKLKNGKRTDGKELKPGTAVFVLKGGSDRSHVGLYIGNGQVIEACGTKSGVIYSKITNTKWAEWGELKGVLYEETSYTPSSPTVDPTPSMNHIGTAVVNAEKVALRSAPSTSASILTRVNKNERVQILDNEWSRVTYQGKTGYMMTKFLDIAK